MRLNLKISLCYPLFSFVLNIDPSYPPMLSLSHISFPAESGDSPDCMFQMQISNPYSKEKKSLIWCIIMGGLGYRDCKLHLCHGMQSFPPLLWELEWLTDPQASCYFPDFLLYRHGAWEAQFNNPLILLAKITIILPGLRVKGRWSES